MSHPYHRAEPHRLWRKAVADEKDDTDPVVHFPIRIAPEDVVVAAGSCFAQYISRWLQNGGFSFLVTEPAHPILPAEVAEAFHYGRFTARYGNIYTARQLLQLLSRAYGRFEPNEDMWPGENGAFIDPFRPQIQPGGFATIEEFQLDRAQHFSAVRRAFETMDVFIFTLGLTESWESTVDGAVFPVCPGTAGGSFKPDVHMFRNQSVNEIVDDLTAFVDELSSINRTCKVILTVSPVPLVATATDGHVLTATTYSKSVLRVAAEMVAAKYGHVAYFPSYEIITGPQARGRYFAEDLRSMTEAGVERVMGLFFKHATTSQTPVAAPTDRPDPGEPHSFLADVRVIVDALCDEEKLDAGP